MRTTSQTVKTDAELDALDYDCDWLTLCERYGETREEWTFGASGEPVLIRKYGWVGPEIRKRWELARGKMATTEAFSRRPRRRKRKKVRENDGRETS
ncbi:MAG: hypothetical protein J6K25_10615 [Thermoguttaceae bacterium]|nr:hypothetical protein [Thermoguttaceae bacterium]